MLVSELIQEVRNVCDEDNTSDLTNPKILAALNRAQQRLARLAAKHYPEMLKRTYSTTLAAGSSSLTIPGISQSATVTQADVKYGGVWYPVIYTNTNNVQMLEGSLRSSVPQNFTQQGDVLTFYPALSGSVEIRIRHEIRPYKLVLEQGRITDVDTASGYLYLDALGSSLSTSVSNLSAFINVIDQTTGDVKGTYQVSAIDTSAAKLTIKASALGRTTVYGLTVDDALASSITQDDLVCLASGTCIPLYFRDYTDFLIQYAANEVKRSYGLLTEQDTFAMKDIEDDVKQMWIGRPNGLRMQARNRIWNRNSNLR